jgi:dTDP-glucose pyrophosphorylase
MIKLIIIYLDELKTSDFQIIGQLVNDLQSLNCEVYALCKEDFENINIFQFNKVINVTLIGESLYDNYKKTLYDIFMNSNYLVKETLVISSKYDILKACKNICVNSYFIRIEDLDSNKVIGAIKYYEDSNNGILKKTPFQKNINIVIPIAGDGSRFLTNPRDTLQKPLRDIFNKPIISWVLNNIKIDANYIFIVRESHTSIRLTDILKSMIPDCQIILTKQKTQGSVCSILLAEKIINNSTPLLIANDNQWLDWDPEEFVLDFLLNETDSKLKLSTFISNGSHRYNYIDFDEYGKISRILLTKPRTQFAITGISLWRNGEDFVRCSHKMISCNKRIKGEFCTDLVINELLDEINITKEDCKEEMSLDPFLSSLNNINKNIVIKKECDFFVSLQDHDDIFEFKHYWKHKNSY